MNEPVVPATDNCGPYAKLNEVALKEALPTEKSIPPNCGAPATFNKRTIPPAIKPFVPVLVTTGIVADDTAVIVAFTTPFGVNAELTYVKPPDVIY